MSSEVGGGTWGPFSTVSGNGLGLLSFAPCVPVESSARTVCMFLTFLLALFFGVEGR